MRERCIYPRRVWRYDPPGSDTGSMVEYDLYHRTVATKKVGDIIVSFAGAPCIGRMEEQITRIDESGVYGVCVFNNFRELTAADIR